MYKKAGSASSKWSSVIFLVAFALLYLYYWTGIIRKGWSTNSYDNPVVDEAIYAKIKQEIPQPVEVMLESLKDGGPFTFFAPSKAAFIKLGKLTNGNFQRAGVREALTNLLADHILPGRILTRDLPLAGVKVVSIGGREVRVSSSPGSGGLMVEGIRVSRSDLLVGNGVVHIIEDSIATAQQIQTLSGQQQQKDLQGKLGKHKTAGVVKQKDPKSRSVKESQKGRDTSSHEGESGAIAAKRKRQAEDEEAAADTRSATQHKTVVKHRDQKDKTDEPEEEEGGGSGDDQRRVVGKEEMEEEEEAEDEDEEEDGKEAGSEDRNEDESEEKIVDDEREDEDKVEKDSQRTSVDEDDENDREEEKEERSSHGLEEGEDRNTRFHDGGGGEEGRAHREERGGSSEQTQRAEAAHKAHMENGPRPKPIMKFVSNPEEDFKAMQARGFTQSSLKALRGAARIAGPPPPPQVCSGHGEQILTTPLNTSSSATVSGSPGGGGGKQHHRCICAAAFRGDKCQVALSLSDQAEKSKGGAGKSKTFSGNFILNRDHLDTLQALQTETPLKSLVIVSNITRRIRAQLHDILPKRDMLAGKFYKSCALVASSGVLLRSMLGEDIDKHEMVLRFNAAPTLGYEHYVGTKTTIRISNGEHLGFRESQNEMVVHHLRSHSFLVKLLWFNKAFPHKVPYVIDPDFSAYVARAVDSIPSSGFFAILLAAQMCHKVRLYGFYASNRHGARHHYYNTETPSNKARDESEFLKVMRLVQYGVVEFGDPCVRECHASREACEACWGGVSLEELATKERWTAAMREENARREQQWAEFIKWDWKMDSQFEWEDSKGLVPIPMSRQIAEAKAKAKEKHKAAARD